MTQNLFKWTEPQMIRAVETSCRVWQEQLHLRDIQIRVQIDDRRDEPWLQVSADNGHENTDCAYITVARSALRSVSAHDVFSGALHEMLHVMLWPMSLAIESLRSNFLAPSQYRMIDDALHRGNEAIVYKLERLWMAMPHMAAYIPSPDAGAEFFEPSAQISLRWPGKAEPVASHGPAVSTLPVSGAD